VRESQLSSERHEESSSNVISFEDLDLNIFAHFFLSPWMLKTNMTEEEEEKRRKGFSSRSTHAPVNVMNDENEWQQIREEF
jgi:hypothetical protein